MTRNLLFALLVAFSTFAQGQDTTEARLRDLEKAQEVTTRINIRAGIEIIRLNEKVAMLEKQSRRDDILIEALIGEVIELKKRVGK